MNYDNIIIKRGKEYRVFAGTEIAANFGNKTQAIKYFNQKVSEIKDINQLLVHYCAFGLVNGMQINYCRDVLLNVQSCEHYLTSNTREWWVYAYKSLMCNYDLIQDATGLKSTFILNCLDRFLLKGR